jgi:hypothetical protein
VNGTPYASISDCYTAIPACTYSPYPDGNDFFTASGGGTCVVPAYWSDPPWTQNLQLQSCKSIYFSGPAVITQGTFQVTAAGGVHGVGIVAQPHDNKLRGSGVIFDYSGNSDAWVLGDSSATIDDLTLQGIQLHCLDGGVGCQPLHLINSQYSRFIELDLVRNATSSATGKAMLVSGGFGNYFEGIRFNGPVQYTDGTAYNTWIRGNGATMVNNELAAFDIQNGTNNQFLYPNRTGGGTTFANFFNFGASASNNEVFAHNGLSTTNTASFVNGSMNNVYHCQGGNCLLTDSSPITAGNVMVTRPNPLLYEQGPTSPLGGDFTDQTIYSYTIPANSMAPGRGLHVRIWTNHSSGSGDVTYKIFFGATAYAADTVSAAGQKFTDITVFNNAAVQNAQHGSTFSTGIVTGPYSPIASQEDTTGPVIIRATFNASGTEEVTGGQFVVELAP